MRKIEFIGGPGIGKSTLLREVMKMRCKEDTWLTAKEARIKLVKDMDNMKLNVLKLIQICLKLNLLRRFHDVMASIVLAAHEKKAFEHMQEKYDAVAELYLNDLFPDENLSSMQKLKRISFNFNTLFNETMMLEYFRIKDLIIYDEGIVQNNTAFIKEETLKELLDKSNNYTEDMIPSGIIYCYMDRTKYVQRCRQRIDMGNDMFFDSGLNETEIEDLCCLKLKVTEDKVKVLRKYNVPILEADMSNTVEDNAKRAYEFIRKFN